MLAAAIVAALTARGMLVAAHKPVVTGEANPPGGWPADHNLLATLTGADPADVCPVRFGLPVSPHLAAELAGTSLDPAALLAAARAAAASAPVLVAEGVGGLLVPLTATYLVADLARDLGLPIVIAARPGLGTINHAVLTVRAAQAAGLDVRAVVLTPWPALPGMIERSNATTITSLTGVEVAFLPPVARPVREELERAAAGLPIDRWLGP